MVSYSDMAARGREEAREHTTGRRKPKVVEIRHVDEPIMEWIEVHPFPRHLKESSKTRDRWDGIGECRHVLRSVWFQHQLYRIEIGKRITCEDDACKIVKQVVHDEDCCEYIIGSEVERRCPSRAKWDTPMGKVCLKHRNYYEREGYLDTGEWEPLAIDHPKSTGR